MIKEDYVSFETAKLLKEKGFDINTPCKYADKEGAIQEWYDDYRERMIRFDCDEGDIIEPLTEPAEKYGVYGDTIPAPTLQMAMKWLRETHKIGIFPTTFYRHTKTFDGHNYGCTLVNLETFEVIGNFEDCTFPADSYEETCEAAIKYCLENLI